MAKVLLHAFDAFSRRPWGASFSATEVLYREPEFEFEAILPSIVSSIVAYAVFTFVHGWETLFRILRLAPIISPSELLNYGIWGGFFYIPIREQTRCLIKECYRKGSLR
jgi:CIC family chloride channel protein